MWQDPKKQKSMRKKSNRAVQDDLRPEYDFRSLRVVARGPGRAMRDNHMPQHRAFKKGMARAFDKAMLDAFANTASRVLKEHRSEYAMVLKSKIFDTEGPRSLGEEFFTPADNQIRKLGFAWSEII